MRMDDAVKKILINWGLSHLQDIFLHNRIDIEAFHDLTDEMIRELIVSIGDRSKFCKHFANRDKKISLDEINETTEVIVISSNNEYDQSTLVLPTNEPLMDDTDSTFSYNDESLNHTSVESMLNGELRGKEVLCLYKKKKILDYSKLANVLIDSTLNFDPNAGITTQTFLSWAKQCSEIFTGEIEDTFFNRSTKGTGGILYDKYINKRRLLKEIGLIPPKKMKINAEKEETETGNDLLNFLKNNIQPLAEIILAWEQTVTVRLVQSKDLSIINYYDTYKALQLPTGYILIDIDFKFLHQEHANKLLQMWPSIAGHFIEIAKNDSNSKDLKEFFKKNDSLLNAGNVEVVALLLLPLLLKSGNLKTPSGTSWRPSAIQVQKGFIIHALTNDALQPLLESREKLLGRLKLTDQPMPIFIGPLNNILNAKVKINNTIYEVPSAIKAIDICYKAYFVLNAEYPAESKHVWSFIQQYVYNMTDTKTKKFTCVNKLISTLNKLNR